MNSFVALTAIIGGIVLATGAEESRFPAAWLEHTPWTSYLVPGLILTFVVGGSALLAAVAVARRAPAGGLATAVAALVLAGQIAGELALLAQPDPPSPTEVFYLVLAGCMLACGVFLRNVGHAEPVGRGG